MTHLQITVLEIDHDPQTGHNEIRPIAIVNGKKRGNGWANLSDREKVAACVDELRAFAAELESPAQVAVDRPHRDLLQTIDYPPGYFFNQ